MLTRRLVLSIFALMALALPLLADPVGSPGYNAVPTDLYVSPNNNRLSIPSGDINLVPGVASTTAVAKDPAAVPADTINMLGCGGVGQGEYTSGLYNMPESFNKFQTDSNSLLSKQLLTMNFALPQTAALFDQLNNYGNQKYQSFQQGCSVDALKQDAKKQYLDACVAKLTPDRVTVIKTVLTGQNPPPKDEMINAMAYAQAWEVCSNQYVSDTTAFGMRKDMNQAFAKQVRDLENVTNAIKPLLCTAKTKNSAGSTSPDNGCWQTLLIPQVRLCLDDTLGCDDDKGYSINEPLLTMPRLFDTLRYIVDDVIVSRRITEFSQQVLDKNIPLPIQKLAANEAVLLLSNATLGRMGETGGTTTGTGGSDAPTNGAPANETLFFGNAINGTQTLPDPSVAEFQLSYLNCKDADPMTPLKQYAQKLNDRMKPVGGAASNTNTVTPRTLVSADYTKVIESLGLTDADPDQLIALRMLAWSSVGCTANQSIPIFDPNLTASLQVCEPQDRYAFYSMAGYDVALTATRDIYRYLDLNLKRTYTRLLTQSRVPVNAKSTTTADTKDADAAPDAAATSALPAVANQELNARLARVVKEVMIPQVEAQIERLDDLNSTRGQFAQRVQQIYTAKAGCVYTPDPALPKKAPRPTSRSRG